MELTVRRSAGDFHAQERTMYVKTFVPQKIVYEDLTKYKLFHIKVKPGSFLSTTPASLLVI